MRLQRLISKELVSLLITFSVALLSVAFIQHFSKMLSKVVAGEMPLASLVSVVVWYTPQLLNIVLPLSLFLAVLVMMGRHSVSLELGATLSSGVGWAPYQRSLFQITVATTLLVALNGFVWMPSAMQQRDTQLMNEDKALAFQLIVPGRFHAFSHDDLIVYVEGLAESENGLSEVFIAEKDTDKGWLVTVANQGELLTGDEGEHFVRLTGGRRYHGHPQGSALTTVAFDALTQRLESRWDKQPQPIYPKTIQTHHILSKLSDSKYAAEWYWRLSIPLATIVLSIFAFAIGPVPPRKGRFYRLLPGAVFFILYFNAISMTKKLIGSGAMTWIEAVGLVHGVSLTVSLITLAHQQGQLHLLLYQKRMQSR